MSIMTQWRNPTGWLGRLLLRGMNITHSGLTDWGLTHVAIRKCDAILDVGCGGGRTVQKLAGIAASGRVYGIDSSEASVIVSRRANKQFIETGQVEIRHGSVSSLPFPDSEFDLVTAVNTHCHWPDLVAGMKEVLRVLRPGGTLMILAGAYKGGRHSALNERFVQLINVACQSRDELGGLLAAAGYSGVQVFEEVRRGWICGVGRKPRL
ncbi:MAG TPA: class I SAM-dependent methyltransferase [Terracidiphilus sp.]